MSSLTGAWYSYGSNAAKEINSGEGAPSLLEQANKTSVQCRSQSSSYTSGSMHTYQMLYFGSKTVLYLQDQDSKQWYATHCIYSRALWYPQPAHWVSHCSSRSQNLRIIKAMGRWSSDCYRNYIHTPHRILRSLSSKLCASQNYATKFPDYCH